MKKALLFFFFLCLIQGIQAQIHVDSTATGANDGSSWTDAYTKLQDALTNSSPGDTIFVSKGTYYPDEGAGFIDNTRDSSFRLRDSVVMLGGFCTGTGATTLSLRDWMANPTTLGGDIGILNDSTDNSYHVVTSRGLDSVALLDGFTITGGNANGAFNSRGGGILNINSSPRLSNLNISNNSTKGGDGNGGGDGSGGGMYNRNSAPNMSNITFSNNSAIGGNGAFTGGAGAGSGKGGGMYNENANPIMSNITFSSNSATGGNGFIFGGFGGGGGLYNENSAPSMSNITFNNNSATGGGGFGVIGGANIRGNGGLGGGGGLYNEDSAPNMMNIVFSSNSAMGGKGNSNDDAFGDGGDGNGGGLFNEDSAPSMSNVALSGNSASGGNGSGSNSNGTVLGDGGNGNGGGLYNDDSNPIMTNTTFSGNSATRGNGNGSNGSGIGGGVYNRNNSAPKISNTIIWNNAASGNTNTLSASVANMSGSNPIFSYSLIANSGGSDNWTTAIGQDNGDNKDTDPQFIMPNDPNAAPNTAGNLRLRSYSLAINMGNNDSIITTGVMVDLDSTPRIQQAIVDMGAYEQPGIICPSTDTVVACDQPSDITALGSVDGLVLIAPDSFYVQNDSTGFDGSCDNDTIGRIHRFFIIADTSNGDRDTICSQRISVIDTVAPIITTCAGDTSISFTAYLQDTLLGQLSATDNCQAISDFTFTDDIQPVGGILKVTRTNIATDGCGRADSCEQQVTVAGALVNARVLLSGPLGIGNMTNSVMWDSLRSKGLIPLTSPYSTAETISATILSDQGNNSIVDWVLLELRDHNDSSRVLSTRSALVQRDGDVVDTNGMAPVLFDTTGIAGFDSLYVAVKHRNHLGAMTAQIQATNGAELIDFTDISGDFYNKGFAPQDSIHSPNVFSLWPGNANQDSQIDASDEESIVRSKVLTASQNTFELLNYIRMGYCPEDVNMDGSVIYAGQRNDIDVILDAIYRHPQNGAQDSGFVVPEQLPSP